MNIPFPPETLETHLVLSPGDPNNYIVDDLDLDATCNSTCIVVSLSPLPVSRNILCDKHVPAKARPYI
jgi:hypothetical protein